MSLYQDPESRSKRKPEPSAPLFEQSFYKFEQTKSGLSTNLLSGAQCETGVLGERGVNNPAPAGSRPMGTFHANGATSAPDKARARRNDPATSKASAKSVSLTNLGRTKDRIMNVLRTQGPMTDEQLYDYFVRFVEFFVSPSGLRTRRSWLVDHGFVVEAGTGKTAANRNCTVWKIK